MVMFWIDHADEAECRV